MREGEREIEREGERERGRERERELKKCVWVGGDKRKRGKLKVTKQNKREKCHESKGKER